MKSNKSYHAIGVMSGSSLDGVDVAYCTFNLTDNQWNFTINQAHCFEFKNDWAEKLKKAPLLSGFKLTKLDVEFGRYLGKICNQFIIENQLKVDFIASHGHTIFHEPNNGFTLQIGNGFVLQSVTNKTTITNFRDKDVALGGQGAPIVPIIDLLLYPQHKFCLNLGGIANLSLKQNNSIVAFDICACNQALNFLALKKGVAFDKGGLLARSGQINQLLLEKLNQNKFYNLLPPKSLSNQWVENNVITILQHFNDTIENKLNTVCHYITQQVKNACDKFSYNPNDNLLVTGGGAYNNFLLELLKKNLPLSVLKPSNIEIEFKEAMAMAFLGVLCLENKPNVLSSVTGASCDNVGGVVFKH